MLLLPILLPSIVSVIFMLCFVLSFKTFCRGCCTGKCWLPAGAAHIGFSADLDATVWKADFGHRLKVDVFVVSDGNLVFAVENGIVVGNWLELE